MRAYTADKGEQLLDIALPLTSGVGPPMTYMLDGKQYIAVMAGKARLDAAWWWRWRWRESWESWPGGTHRGSGRQCSARSGSGGCSDAAPPADQAAPAAPAANKPRLFVYTLDAPGSRTWTYSVARKLQAFLSES